MALDIRRAATEAVVALLFTATLLGNLNGVYGLVSQSIRGMGEWEGRDYRGNGENTDAFRELVEKHLAPGERLYYCSNSKDGRLSPAERSTHLALAWAQSPTPVEFGNAGGVGEASAVIASRYLRVDFPGYWLVAENETAALWRRGDLAVESTDAKRINSTPAPWFEFSGAFAVCAMIALFACGMVREKKGGARENLSDCNDHSFGNSMIPSVAAIVFFCVAAFLTLTHTFLAPNGLGVYGGKARLLFQSGCIPEGFFVNPAFSSYQPAYPPGLVLLTLGAYWIAGGCGEWLIQLIPAFTAAVVLWLMTRFAVESRWAVPWLVAAFLGIQTLQMSTQFYAEPFVALFSMLGWMRLRKRRDDVLGWLLIGSSGLFKVEGLVLLLAVWVSLSANSVLSSKNVYGRLSLSFWFVRLLAASSLPLSWHVGCRLAGAEFYDYASFFSPDSAKFCEALCYLMKTAFLEPWRYGFAYPIAAAVVAFVFGGKLADRECDVSPSLAVSAFVALICPLSFAAIYSLSLAPDFEWHLWSSEARLLWIPSLFILLECAAISKRASHKATFEKDEADFDRAAIEER
jgi:hypothetical protein